MGGVWGFTCMGQVVLVLEGELGLWFDMGWVLYGGYTMGGALLVGGYGFGRGIGGVLYGVYGAGGGFACGGLNPGLGMRHGWCSVWS
ncbi:hypothetical protein QBC32DRAFT_349776 [Pseudoneurospora amorphoporcata]|uniref:Uncharacterized protein n=1 Tax=Pseudoneurospora amorphoporcata TaxID=241081 RepID=A0AAN6NSP4_9PEZI|nr:hypothetical protein QBC32DRAFT_349776 [Pseudoneurospora amorphoporcata]